jgi:hypothetical protein
MSDLSMVVPVDNTPSAVAFQMHEGIAEQGPRIVGVGCYYRDQHFLVIVLIGLILQAIVDMASRSAWSFIIVVIVAILWLLLCTNLLSSGTYKLLCNQIIALLLSVVSIAFDGRCPLFFGQLKCLHYTEHQVSSTVYMAGSFSHVLCMHSNTTDTSRRRFMTPASGKNHTKYYSPTVVIPC